MTPPNLTDLQEWLEVLHQADPTVSVDDNRHSERESDLHSALIALDGLRGFAEQVQELWLSSDPAHAPLGLDDSLPAVCTIASGVGSTMVPAVLSPAEVDRLTSIERELAALRHHRDAVVADHLAVMSSESWRVGHAVTWPVRLFRGSPRGAAARHAEPGPAESGS